FGFFGIPFRLGFRRLRGGQQRGGQQSGAYKCVHLAKIKPAAPNPAGRQKNRLPKEPEKNKTAGKVSR
ncbi:MAG: hypothetical protein RL276_1576, partial [Bacteroidota bacterium]